MTNENDAMIPCCAVLIKDVHCQVIKFSRYLFTLSAITITGTG